MKPTNTADFKVAQKFFFILEKNFYFKNKHIYKSFKHLSLFRINDNLTSMTRKTSMITIPFLTI